MQSEVFNNAQILISTSTSAPGTRDISNRVMKLELQRQKDDFDDTVMGETAHTYILGLEKWSFKTEMIQSFSTADGGENTDQLLNTLYALPSGSQKFYMQVKKSSTGLLGSGNPIYSGLVVLVGFSPLAGEVGNLLKSSVEFRGSSTLGRSATSSS